MTKPSLTIAVMACPPRADRAAALASRLEVLAEEARAIGYEVRPPVVSMDTEMVSPRHGASLAWALAGAASHHLVIQDDAIPCADFVVAAMRAIEAAPTPVVSFFTTSPYSVRKPGPNWYRPTFFVGSVAVVAERAIAERISRELARARDTDDDLVIDRCLHSARIRISVAVPNLVDHDLVPSTMGHRQMKSRSFVGEGASGRDIQWPVAEKAPLSGELACLR